MDDHPSTRRDSLRRIGALAGGSLLAGCSSQNTSGTARATRTPSKTPPPTEPSPPILETDRTYADVLPHPETLGTETPLQVTSTEPTTAAAHEAVFGENADRFASRWVETPRRTSIARTPLNVWIGTILCMIGDVHREEEIEDLERFRMDRLGSRGEFDLYEGSPNGISQQTIAISDRAMLVDKRGDRSGSVDRVTHLVDLLRGEVDPYHERHTPTQRLVRALPQGVFTRVDPAGRGLDRPMREAGIDGFGETLTVDRARDPAAGVTVLHSESPIDDPQERARELLDEHESFGRFRTTEAVVTTAETHVLAFEHSADPEVVFA